MDRNAARAPVQLCRPLGYFDNKSGRLASLATARIGGYYVVGSTSSLFIELAGSHDNEVIFQGCVYNNRQRRSLRTSWSVSQSKSRQ